MYNVKVTLEYDGSGFHGWQSQPDIRTIQDELQKVIKKVLKGCELCGTVTASGRTDSGVHARGQVCNFHISEETDLERLKHSINGLFKGELAVLDIAYTEKDFNSCRDASSKQYTYTILYRPAPAVLDYGKAWHIGRPLNIELMSKEAAKLEGVHDFQSFRASGCGAKSSIKEVYSSKIIAEPPYLKYVVCGNGFLKQMVRNIVGSLIDVSDQRLEPGDFTELLKLKDRTKAGVTAPAHGLCLDWVRY